MTSIAIAERALSRFQRHGAKAAAVPTPQRLVRDAGHARVERTLEFVPIVTADGTPDVAVIRAAHVRVTGEAFERMGARGLLAPGDADRNRQLLAAARRFQRDWHEAGLSPLQGQDPGKIRSTSIHPGLLCGGERQSNAWDEYRQALAVLDRGERIAVEAIVLHDKLAVWVGSKISGLVDKGGQKATGMYAFRGGLEKLAVHYGLLVAPAHDPMDDIMAGLLGEIDAAEARAS